MTQMQEVETRLRRMILDMEIGPGERLTERWIETQLNASRTSIRPALFRLEAEGLVAREGRGWMVPPLDLEEIAQLFAYREVLEVAGLRRAAPDAAAAQVEEIERLLEEMRGDHSPEAIDQAGRQFHLWIAGLAQNEFIIRGVADAMARLQRARWLEAEPGHHGWEEHRAILAAIRAGETAQAAALLEAHLRDTCARLLAALAGQRRTLRARGVSVKERS